MYWSVGQIPAIPISILPEIGAHCKTCLLYTSGGSFYSILSFSWAGLKQGQLWRLLSFSFLPMTTSPFWLLVSCYFYYWIGSTLEREWGTAKFTIYYLSGVLLTALGATITSLITGYLSLIHI